MQLMVAMMALRVGLADRVPEVVFSSAQEARLVGADGAAIAIHSRDPWVATGKDGHLRIKSPEGGWMDLAPPARLGGAGPVYIGRHWYRGGLELRVADDQVIAINELPLEDYLLGVVPAEMVPSWPLEALKAQAVAARTYALRHRGDFEQRGFDLFSTVQSQVYQGLEAEASGSSIAVWETRGEVLTQDGSPINAYYCAAAGGYTEGAEAVWGFERRTAKGGKAGYPYLQPVPDFDWDSPHAQWSTARTPEEVAQALSKQGFALGSANEITVTGRSFSQRARWVKVVGPGGSAELPGQVFRMALGLRSTLFSVGKGTDGNFWFVGRGWGHGVGLSQWGARRMAAWGYDFQAILNHYYPGAELTTITE